MSLKGSTLSYEKIYFTQKDKNKPHVILAMAIGDRDETCESIVQSKLSQTRKPSKKQLIEEAERRYKSQSLATPFCRPPKPNTNWSVEQIIGWLEKHPVTNKACLSFVRKTLKSTYPSKQLTPPAGIPTDPTDTPTKLNSSLPSYERAYLDQNDEDKPNVILAMAIGHPDESVSRMLSSIDQTHKPMRKHLFEEAFRRYQSQRLRVPSSDTLKPKAEWTDSEIEGWLLHHPLDDSASLSFVKDQLKLFSDSNQLGPPKGSGYVDLTGDSGTYGEDVKPSATAEQDGALDPSAIYVSEKKPYDESSALQHRHCEVNDSKSDAQLESTTRRSASNFSAATKSSELDAYELSLSDEEDSGMFEAADKRLSPLENIATESQGPEHSERAGTATSLCEQQNQAACTKNGKESEDDLLKILLQGLDGWLAKYEVHENRIASQQVSDRLHRVFEYVTKVKEAVEQEGVEKGSTSTSQACLFGKTFIEVDGTRQGLAKSKLDQTQDPNETTSANGDTLSTSSPTDSEQFSGTIKDAGSDGSSIVDSMSGTALLHGTAGHPTLQGDFATTEDNAGKATAMSATGRDNASTSVTGVGVDDQEALRNNPVHEEVVARVRVPASVSVNMNTSVAGNSLPSCMDSTESTSDASRVDPMDVSSQGTMSMETFGAHSTSSSSNYSCGAPSTVTSSGSNHSRLTVDDSKDLFRMRGGGLPSVAESSNDETVSGLRSETGAASGPPSVVGPSSESISSSLSGSVSSRRMPRWTSARVLRDKQGRLGVYTGEVVRLGLRFRVPHGKGCMQYKDGRRYEGEWVDGAWQGHGKVEFAEGGTYVGDFKKGLFCGKGIRHYKDGSQYEGTFVGGLRMGGGTFRDKNGVEFRGEWVSNQTLSDGSRYDGFWQDEKQHGYGRQEFPNGDFYEGKCRLWVSRTIAHDNILLQDPL